MRATTFEKHGVRVEFVRDFTLYDGFIELIMSLRKFLHGIIIHICSIFRRFPSSAWFPRHGGSIAMMSHFSSSRSRSVTFHSHFMDITFHVVATALIEIQKLLKLDVMTWSTLSFVVVSVHCIIIQIFAMPWRRRCSWFIFLAHLEAVEV